MIIIIVSKRTRVAHFFKYIGISRSTTKEQNNNIINDYSRIRIIIIINEYCVNILNTVLKIYVYKFIRRVIEKKKKWLTKIVNNVKT